MNTHLLIKQKILFLEQSFDVDKWNVNGIHIWPYIRIKLYFLLLTNLNDEDKIKCQEQSSVVKRRSFYVLKKVQLVFSLIICFFKNELFFFRLMPKKVIFFGSHIHRVKHKEYYFNRFFDSMVDSHNLQDLVYMVEHQKVYDVNFNQKAIISLVQKLKDFTMIQKLKDRFKKKNLDVYLEDYNVFLELLSKEIPNVQSLSISENDMIRWTKKIKTLDVFYTRMFSKVKPEKIIFPGYYAWDNLYAAVFTANKLKIRTIDFQHGPQTNVHMVFSSWTKIPDRGYGIMPTEYWTWDENSKINIDKWAQKTSNVISKIVGQPYLEYWKQKNKDLVEEKKIVLYSLQLMPLTQMLSDIIIALIINSPKHWKIRLHPRNEFDKRDIEEYLDSKGVKRSSYSIHDSKECPLPEVLTTTHLHVTAFSGCLIEAKMMGIPSVIINRVGKEIYKDYIDNELVFYLNQDEIDFKDNFYKLIEKNDMTILVIARNSIVNPILT
ncbi:hypothetical protein SAMN05443543_108163 [Flavobacterium flevense]|uniref:Capsule polysaccharide biosynthesis protein n=1 Tax=Flavobacterium flevense TaxID=983 RepID=A0A4Y4AZP1_9FLAO|nr:hypothetical protein [Flavobacterium flevense]GEC73668.1 hypothetical protein FFL01_32070 [Flavobacterium flevense]SHL99904.1 hypothetical protein SAMN05443543_108163 [Flavobacterium flevense]